MPATDTDPLSDVDADHERDRHDRHSQRSDRRVVAAATLATALLCGVVAFAAVGGDDPPDARPPAVTPDVTATDGSTDAVSIPPIQPVVSTVPERTLAPVEPTPVVPPPIAPPVVPPVETSPPGPPPSAAVLVVQPAYTLDPGVHGVAIRLANHGDLTLDFSIDNDGDGFSADRPSGTIAPASSEDIWIDLDATSDGDGPTPIEQVVHVVSNGGEAAVTIDGQVEKPGHVIAEFADVPVVDNRATVRFANVGGLSVEITGVDAPGLRVAPLPERIGAGQTLEVDVAFCAGDGLPPIYVPLPQPQSPGPHPPTFLVGSWVALETVAGSADEAVIARTELRAVVTAFVPLDCSPVVETPVDELAL